MLGIPGGRTCFPSSGAGALHTGTGVGIIFLWKDGLDLRLHQAARLGSRSMSAIVDFECPPLNEVICGLHFRRMDRFTAPYVGLLWQKFQTHYPKCEVHPPLTLVSEQDTELQLEMSSFPRVWFVSEDSTRLVQVQQDLLIHNWRQVESSTSYPRYKIVKDGFDDALSKFEAFVADHGLGAVEARQYELSYVNFVPQGDGYESLGELGRLLPDFAWRRNTSRFLPDPSNVNYQTVFDLPNNNGKLRVSIQDALRRSDEKKLTRILIVVRGMHQSQDVSTPDDWFELAHEWIVRAFLDLTSEEVQVKHWRKK